MNKLYKAAYAKAVAQKEEALATLDIYFNNAAGIGEHPDLLTEVDKYVELLAGANDKIEALKLYAQEETSQETAN
jgi:hypothetical protein|tara:strand:- start:1193 stop:1417 length:225 start_codon:yes stop_codon:yes gene_type:complete